MNRSLFMGVCAMMAMVVVLLAVACLTILVHFHTTQTSHTPLPTPHNPNTLPSHTPPDRRLVLPHPGRGADAQRDHRRLRRGSPRILRRRGGARDRRAPLLRRWTHLGTRHHSGGERVVLRGQPERDVRLSGLSVCVLARFDTKWYSHISVYMPGVHVIVMNLKCVCNCTSLLSLHATLHTGTADHTTARSSSSTSSTPRNAWATAAPATAWCTAATTVRRGPPRRT